MLFYLTIAVYLHCDGITHNYTIHVQKKSIESAFHLPFSLPLTLYLWVQNIMPWMVSYFSSLLLQLFYSWVYYTVSALARMYERPRKLHISKQNRSGKDFLACVLKQWTHWQLCCCSFRWLIEALCFLPLRPDLHTYGKYIRHICEERKLMTCHHLGRLQSFPTTPWIMEYLQLLLSYSRSCLR